jgi:L-lactate dehydrogenase (cytochrome)/(S)-mandelate dehydrogenase
MFADLAREADIPFILSGNANASIETIAPRAPEHVWYQVYGAKDPDLTDDLIRRARDAGAAALVFTIDYPVPPRSEVSVRTGASLTIGPRPGALPHLMLDALRHPAWAIEFLRDGGLPTLGSWSTYAPAGSSAGTVARYFSTHWHGVQTWRDLDRIRRLWPGPLVVKGILRGDDARAALGAGADAVTVSNHGGNRLDILPATLDALAEVRQAVGPSAKVFFDGGIRRGTDILIAYALGADFCFLGRAMLYGVTAAGAAGAALAVSLLQEELAHALAMSGCWSIANIELVPLDADRRSIEL